MQEKAQQQLQKLKQGNKGFMEYYTEFCKLILEAGGNEWPEQIKKAYLEAGLNVELQRIMLGREITCEENISMTTAPS